MAQPLLPKATAAWLVEHTGLSFQQIADFCGMHVLEIEAIADGEVGVGILGVDPVLAGQLTRAEIARCEADPQSTLKSCPDFDQFVAQNRKHKSRYTPIARRQDKPDAIAWLLRHCPQMPDHQIVKLIGTTKNTIENVRAKTHWNAANIRPRDPVLLGLCSQTHLDAAMNRYHGVVGAADADHALQDNG